MLQELSKKRVLFTGGGSLVISDLMKHIPNAYEASSCSPDEMQLLAALFDFRPHTIVVCLAKESEEMLTMYHLLDTDPNLQNLPVIVIGSESCCALFQRIISSKYLTVFPRPFNKTGYLEVLSQYTALAANHEASLPMEVSPLPDAMEKIAELQVETASAVTGKKNLCQYSLDLIHDRRIVLVVDDDVRILNIIKLYLQDLFDVIVVPSGRLALKYLSRQHADIILLDYMMPVEDGPAVLRQIRENSPHPDVPVLFLTGVSEKDLVLRGLEYHPDGYCLKPVTQEALIERITAILLNL